VSHRYAQITRVDKTTKAIVDALRECGYRVEYIGRPVDLLVSHASWPPNTWKLLECKTPEGKKGQVWHRDRMKKQQDFCSAHAVPYTVNAESAIKWLQENRP
jgi:hypothetical protein